MVLEALNHWTCKGDPAQVLFVLGVHRSDGSDGLAEFAFLAGLFSVNG